MARPFFLIALIILMQATAPAEAADVDSLCDASVVDVATAEVASPHATPDIYIAGAETLLVEPGSIFKIFRKKEVITETGRSVVQIYIGRLTVLSAQNGISVGRMIEFAPREEYPHVRYETVMVGDCLVLDSPPAKPENEPTEETLEAPAQPVPLPEAQPSPDAPAAKRRRVIPPKILFDFDSAAIKPQWREQLDLLGGFISERHIRKVYVEGHADSIGTEEYNLRLSRKRAQAVVDYLVNGCGLDGGIFEMLPCGEGRPETSNDSDEGRRRNRRVFISVLFDAIPATGEEVGELEEWPIAVTPESVVPEAVELPIIR